MDDLAAAACVLAMHTDSEGDEEMVLETTDSSVSAAAVVEPELCCTGVDKENDSNLPILQGPQAEVHKVATGT